MDVSTLPLDVCGVSFMLMGDVDRSLCEGLILQHGGSVGSRVLRKQQYVIVGPAKRSGWSDCPTLSITSLLCRSA